MADNRIQALATKVKEQIQKVIVGKDSTVELMLCAMIAKGHVLLEDVPGTVEAIEQAVQSGEITEERLDESGMSVIWLMYGSA